MQCQSLRVEGISQTSCSLASQGVSLPSRLVRTVYLRLGMFQYERTNRIYSSVVMTDSILNKSIPLNCHDKNKLSSERPQLKLSTKKLTSAAVVDGSSVNCRFSSLSLDFSSPPCLFLLVTSSTAVLQHLK